MWPVVRSPLPPPGVPAQTPGGDADRRAVGRAPEQARAAAAAEASPRPGITARAGEPAQVRGTVDHEVLARYRGHRAQVTVPPPTLRAMADRHVARRATDRVAHRPTQAPSRGHANAARGPLPDDLLEDLVGDVEVGVDRADVVVLLERLDEPEQLGRSRLVELAARGRALA